MADTTSHATNSSDGSPLLQPEYFTPQPDASPDLSNQFGAEGTVGYKWDRNGRPRAYHKVPILQAGDKLGAGDSHLVMDVLPKDLADGAFDKMKEEVAWNTMHHRGIYKLPGVFRSNA
jgi:hypothetical protein